MGSLTWNRNTDSKTLFLTFDDGPTQGITPWVLSVLEQYNAKATFFCIGKNIEENPAIYQSLINAGHAIGNHTQNHLNGWKTANSKYFKNVDECQKLVQSPFFRPPYGKISRSQAKKLKEQYEIIMWDVLSADFDQSITKEKCFTNVINNARKGSIIVMHDSVKAYPNLKYILPKVLEYFTEEGYRFEALKQL